MPDSHWVMISLDLAVNVFYSGETDRGMSITMFWGVDGVDKQEVNQWDPEDLGTIIWDNSFDLSPSGNQQAFYDLCQDLRTQSFVRDGLADCWIEDFKLWLESSNQ